MQKNEIYETVITGMTDEGDGVGRVEKMAVFVPYTLVGERVRILIVKVLKHYAYGKLLEVLSPSVHRVKAECPYFYQCGGCQLWHMDLEAELEYKKHKVEDCLNRIGGICVPVQPVVMAGDQKRYRNKAQFPVTPEGIGFYRRNSHTVIPIEDCLIQGEWNQNIVSAVKVWMQEENISPYDEKMQKGFLRHIYTRAGNNGILVTLVTNGEDFLQFQSLKEKILQAEPRVIGITQNINTKATNVVLGQKNKTLWGKDHVTDAVGKTAFSISPMSFYQVNTTCMQSLYEGAAAFAQLTGREIVWDLYCGIGTIGQFMAERAAKIIGIEIVPEAIKNARENAKRNRIENTEYYCGKAEILAPKLAAQGMRPDVVILDPPRKGCDERLLKTVAELAPKRVVYISCKPSTLARDLKYLTAAGFQAEQIRPYNMFPRSAHIETAVLMSRT